MWYIYLGLTVICAGCYWLAGMGGFDAITHSFSTIAIGGFSTHDSSLMHFDSGAVDTVAMLFMIIAGVNFALHFVAWRARSVAGYFRDSEVTVFLLILFCAAVLVVATLSAYETFQQPSDTLRQGLLQVISIATTTGYTTGGYHWWPSFLPLLLLILSFVGGCAGSTAGGIKVVRVLLLYKQGRREINRLIHPSAMLSIKLGGKPVTDSVIQAVWAFFFAYIICYVGLVLLLATSPRPGPKLFRHAATAENAVSQSCPAALNNRTKPT